MSKYHVGCGKRYIPGWVHVDGIEAWHIKSHDIFLRDVPDGSAETIYASHLLEYFDRDEVVALLGNWHRALKFNCTLIIGVPDFEAIADEYEASNNLDLLLGLLYGKMNLNGQNIYHKTVYDFDSLKHLLEQNGFTSVRRYDWRNREHKDYDDHSQAYLPHMDKTHGRLMSLNVECEKLER